MDDASEDPRVMRRDGHTKGNIAGVRDARYMPTGGKRRGEILESEQDQQPIDKSCENNAPKQDEKV